MTQSGIEETIIGYFDGRLSDSEAAELLHLVSVSPEIRQAFQEHREIRAVAQQARVNVMIRPEIEDRLFAHIETLAAGSVEEDEVAAPFWVRGRAAGVAFLLLLAAGLYYGYETYQSGQAGSDGVKRLVAGSELPLLPTAPKANASTATNGVSSSLDNGTIGPVGGVPPAPSKPPVLFGAINKNAGMIPVTADWVVIDPNSAQGREITLNNLIAAAQIEHSEKVEHVMIEWEAEACSRDELGLDPLVHPITKDVPETVGTPEAKTIGELEKIAPQSAKHFEAAFETSSGFAVPSTGQTVPVLADFRLSGAYAFGAADLLGGRVVNGIYSGLSSTNSTTSDGTSIVVNRNLESERKWAAEVFYTHRLNAGSLQVDLTGGAGYIFPSATTSATTLSLELGARLPFSEHIYGNFSVGITRYHSTAATLDQVAQDQAAASNQPVLVSGSNVHNTLNGRLYYGLSYRF